MVFSVFLESGLNGISEGPKRCTPWESLAPLSVRDFTCFLALSEPCQARIGPLLPGRVRKWAHLGLSNRLPPSAQHNYPTAHPDPAP